jgi:protease I
MACKRILIPIPSEGFDPTEVAIPALALRNAGYTVVFATPNGLPSKADPIVLTGQGLGIWTRLLQADDSAKRAYQELLQMKEFQTPIAWNDTSTAFATLDGAPRNDYAGLVLPGGHAKIGMKDYLESHVLQQLVARAFLTGKPVGAICHGVVLVSRSHVPDSINLNKPELRAVVAAETTTTACCRNATAPTCEPDALNTFEHEGTASPAATRSVLYGRRTTALLRQQEMWAYRLTCMWLGDYYLTYPSTTVEDEVRSSLKNPDGDFQEGPLPIGRDKANDLRNGFTVRDGMYLSARWPGDAHKFSHDFLDMLAQG